MSRYARLGQLQIEFSPTWLYLVRLETELVSRPPSSVVLFIKVRHICLMLFKDILDFLKKWIFLDFKLSQNNLAFEDFSFRFCVLMLLLNLQNRAPQKNAKKSFTGARRKPA